MAPAANRTNLILRVVSALVLAPLAIAAAALGGWAFALFWLIAAIGIWYEWVRLVVGSIARPALIAGIATLVMALALAETGRFAFAIAVVAVGVAAATLVAPLHRAGWVGGGLI